MNTISPPFIYIEYNEIMKTYAYNHDPIEFDFLQSVDRFVVTEIPLFAPSGRGDYLLLEIKKRDMSTWKLIHVLKEATGAEDRDIGYAGLKDKSATTTQMISIPKRYEKLLKNVQTDRIEILSKSYNHLPLKVGQLKANRFKIKLTKMTKEGARKFTHIAKMMSEKGIPNYYGYQRYGEDGKSWQQGREIAHSGKRLKGAKEKLLVSSYQGYLFDKWLSKRVSISSIVSQHRAQKASEILEYPLALVEELSKQKQFLKLFIGDAIRGYPHGKESYCKDMTHSSSRFAKREIAPTGLLAGDRVLRAQSDARHLEEAFDDDELTTVRGDRRFAWVWAEDVACSYHESSRSMTVEFTLPRGSYATSFLEEIGKFSLKPTITRDDR